MFQFVGFGTYIFKGGEFAFDVEDAFDCFFLLVFHVDDFGLDGLEMRERVL